MNYGRKSLSPFALFAALRETVLRAFACFAALRETSPCTLF